MICKKTLQIHLHKLKHLYCQMIKSALERSETFLFLLRICYPLICCHGITINKLMFYGKRTIYLERPDRRKTFRNDPGSRTRGNATDAGSGLKRAERALSLS